MRAKFTLLLIFITLKSFSQDFTQIDSAIENHFYASLDWGDYDNDGDQDLIIAGALDTSGDTFADTSQVTLYQNDNGVLTEVATPDIYGLHLGAVKFIDIDNDSDLDIVISGQNYSDITDHYLTIYENIDNTFSMKQQLDGVIYSTINGGDYDNDGDIDLLVSGASSSITTKIYTNTNGTFSDSSLSLPGVQNGNSEFADIDIDGDLDIMILGYDSDYNNFFKTYINTEGAFTEAQTLEGISLGSFATGDYDNDGDLDLAVMGDDPDANYISKIYSNTDGVFTEVITFTTGLDNSSGTTPIAWGDYDNDGDLDLVIAGSDEDYNDITHLYTNNAGVFELVSDSGILDLGGATTLGWSDVDGDLDLDIIVSGFYTDSNDDYTNGTFLHINNTSVVNQIPNAPNNLNATINADNSITFQWDNGTDDFTPVEGLHYWLTVGTTDGGAEIASYAIQGNSWTINDLGNSNYYWSVQTVDTAFAKSDKATSQTLSINEFILEETLSVYPNPASDTVTISAKNSQIVEAIQLFDMQGRSVGQYKEQEISKTITIGHLPTGIYTLQVTFNGKQTTKKIIKK